MFTLSMGVLSASAGLSRELRLVGEVDIDSGKVRSFPFISFFVFSFSFPFRRRRRRELQKKTKK
jgi:hypothetical protein